MLNLSTFDFILAPYPYHDSFLKHKSPHLSDSFLVLTKEQWLNELVLDIDETIAIPYLILQHDLSLSLAKSVLRSFTFIPFPSENTTLQNFYTMYQGLISIGAIKKHKISHLKYKDKKIAVYGYHQKDLQLQSVFNKLKLNPTWLTLPKASLLNPVIAYPSLETEVTAFFNKVAALLKKGVALKNILLLAPSPDYHLSLIRQSKYFKIPIQLDVEASFFTYPIAQTFLSSLPIETSLETIYTFLDSFPKEQLFFLKGLVESTPKDLVESFIFKSYIKDVFLTSYLPSKRYIDAIQVVDACITLPEEHLFILGFNQGSYPKVTKDNGYVSDSIKKMVNLPTTIDDNALSFSLIESMIQQSNQVYISFRNLALDKVILPSSLVYTLNLKVFNADHVPPSVDYSQAFGLFSYASKLDAYNRYHQPDLFLESYRKQYSTKMPLPYSPHFKGLTPLPETIPLSLSYSSMNNFYQCQFKYYLTSILKLETKYDPYYVNLGKLTHQIFERIAGDLSSFDHLFNDVLQSLSPLTHKEKTIFTNLKPTIYKVIRFNLFHQQKMNLSLIESEKSFIVTLDAYTKLKGQIDKVVITQDASKKSYASLIDYKSGLESFKPDHVQFGLSLQLPIYALLMEKHLAYEGIEVIGIYIQHLINTDLSVKDVEINDESFSSSFKLDGIFVDDQKALETFDSSFGTNDSSLFIRALKVKNDGTLGGGKRLHTKESIKALSTQAYDHLIQASEEIRHQSYIINPKHIANEEVCKKCPFQDVCYRRQQDIIALNPKVSQTQEEFQDEFE